MHSEPRKSVREDIIAVLGYTRRGNDRGLKGSRGGEQFEFMVLWNRLPEVLQMLRM